MYRTHDLVVARSVFKDITIYRTMYRGQDRRLEWYTRSGDLISGTFLYPSTWDIPYLGSGKFQ